ncbi:MAG TPA: hypothetical protein VN906_03450 [Candidatus Sulfotelmatobacter sp.]|nr:hypothetical protein [Candidatus Sulfotelmatobacter sp.]
MKTAREILLSHRYLAAGLVVALTLVVATGLVLTTTSLGCGPANKLGLKTSRCINAGPVAHAGLPTPSPSPSQSVNSPSPSPSPVPSSPSPAPQPTSPPSSLPPSQYASSSSYPPMAWPGSGSQPGVILSCSLPVYAGGPGSGGFIVFPGQTFIADPRSAVIAPLPSPAAAASPTPPYGSAGNPPGWWALAYDSAYSKWVPVPVAWLSPDGVHYAFPAAGNIYVEDIPHGTQIELGQGRGFSVLKAENDGVYVTGGPAGGLYFLGYSGTTKQLSATGFWQGVAAGAAYGPPTSSVPEGVANTIMKLDLASGAVTPFFTQAAGQSTVIGFDGAGHPVINVTYPSGYAMFIAVAPNAAAAIAGLAWASGPNPPYPQGPPIADSRGLWFSVGGGIVVYSNGAWYSASAIGGQLGGPCR